MLSNNLKKVQFVHNKPDILIEKIHFVCLSMKKKRVKNLRENYMLFSYYLQLLIIIIMRGTHVTNPSTALCLILKYMELDYA